MAEIGVFSVTRGVVDADIGIPVATIGVEAHMTNPPKPLGFLVKDEAGKVIAVLRYENARDAVARYDEMAGKLR